MNNMNRPVIQKRDDGTFILEGTLTMHTVSELEKEARPLFADVKGSICVDLAEVVHADSSGLALLLEWQRLARRGNFSISFRSLPDQLMQIARVSELQDILPIQA